MLESYEEAILARQESEADDCSNCPFNPRLTGKSCMVSTKHYKANRCSLTPKEEEELEEMEAESAYRPNLYERARARVYATGNKWAIGEIRNMMEDDGYEPRHARKEGDIESND